jgi:CelD/BcsL family acetyltransferase involved in cellulose biosynthesis
MLEAAFRRLGRRGVCWWPNIPTTDWSLGLLRSFFTERGMPYVEERESAPRLRLNGATFEEVERTFTSSHRKDVRRQRKHLSERGPVTLWQPSTLAEAEPVLAEFFRVHDERWLTTGFPGMFQDPAKRRLFEALLRRLWGRGMHFSTVRCGSVDVSYHFGFFSGGWLQWYRPSFRSSYGEFSPGKIHIAMLLEEACRLQWKGIDLLLGAEPYKNLWSNETMEVVSIHAGFHRWSPSYFWFTKGKPLAKQRFQLAYMQATAWVQKRRQSLSR